MTLLPDPATALQEYGLVLQNDPPPADAVVIAVAHDCYRLSGWSLIKNCLRMAAVS
jgi:hypothetical protein